MHKLDSRKVAVGRLTATCLSITTGKAKFPDKIIEYLPDNPQLYYLNLREIDI